MAYTFVKERLRALATSWPDWFVGGAHEDFPVAGVGANPHTLGGDAKQLPLPIQVPLFLFPARRFLQQTLADPRAAGNLATTNRGCVEVPNLVQKDSHEPFLKASFGPLIPAPHDRTQDFLHNVRCIFILRQTAAGEVEDQRAVQAHKLCPASRSWGSCNRSSKVTRVRAIQT